MSVLRITYVDSFLHDHSKSHGISTNYILFFLLPPPPHFATIFPQCLKSLKYVFVVTFYLGCVPSDKLCLQYL